MKKLIYSFCIIILFASGVCRKTCDNYEITSLKSPVEEYFGAYKPGNWWVYQNKNKTKKDSLYVIDFTDKTLKNLTNCVQYEERIFTIKNTYLVNGANVYVTYASHQTGVMDVNFSLLADQVQTAPLPQYIYQSSDNTIYAFPSPYNQGSSIMDSITVNGQSYQAVLVGKYSSDIYYFAKNKGLVGWTANGETFNLINYKIF